MADWAEILNQVVMACNASVHDTNGHPPPPLPLLYLYGLDLNIIDKRFDVNGKTGVTCP